ncbi:hypothetical protein D7Y07_18920 [Bacteroides acidifaciens]|uniref:Uncharacterized protein n=1 Tax=Bacteroides acidifaciens TaxID=85831 RepID=A0A3L7Z9U5_9BACE|nr:hypothetical protein D7Y07_18920 [Bacteroides acidifaciens]
MLNNKNSTILHSIRSNFKSLTFLVYKHVNINSAKQAKNPLTFFIFHGLFFAKSTKITIFALLLKLERQL